MWGTPPAVLTRARDPRHLARVVADAGVPGPRVRLTRPAPGTRSGWLVKPLRSGGGDGIAVWRRGAPVPRGSYLQQRIAGVAGSIVFAADGRRAVPLGLSRILGGSRPSAPTGSAIAAASSDLPGIRSSPRTRACSTERRSSPRRSPGRSAWWE